MKLGDFHKTKHFFWLILKLTIVIACAYYIYLRLTTNSSFSSSQLWETLGLKNLLSFNNVLILIGFSLANWLLEIKKWQALVFSIESISFFEATKQSLSSLTTSLITPNRIGEYGAKILYFKPTIRSKILLLNLFGNLSQLLATLVFGSLGFMYLNLATNSFGNYQYSLYISLGIIILVGFLYFYLVTKQPLYKGKTFKDLTSFIKEIPKRILGLSLFLAVFRFLIFSHEFVFLLTIFDYQIPYWIAISSVSLMYLVASLIPMLSLFDALLKGSVALAIFSQFSQNEVGVLMITLLMWLLNFAIPSVFGSYFVLTFKIKK